MTEPIYASENAPLPEGLEDILNCLESYHVARLTATLKDSPAGDKQSPTMLNTFKQELEHEGDILLLVLEGTDISTDTLPKGLQTCVKKLEEFHGTWDFAQKTELEKAIRQLFKEFPLTPKLSHSKRIMQIYPSDTLDD